MELIKNLADIGFIQLVLGAIALLLTVGVLLLAIFAVMYREASRIANERADLKVERIRRGLEDEFEEYKKSIHVDTEVEIDLYRGVGYAQSRKDRIKRIS